MTSQSRVDYRQLNWSIAWDIYDLSLSVQHSRGESLHHTNGSKAPRLAHFVIFGTLAVVEICGKIVSYMLSAMLVII